MNILFNATKSSLNNNGGSKTIIRSTETLQQLDCNVSILTTVNHFTWFEPKCHIIYSKECNIYTLQTFTHIVAVSAMDLEDTTYNAKEYRLSAFWYMRAWPVWVRGEPWLIQQIKKFVAAGGRIIVNSSWLIDQLKEKCGVGSVLCWAGLDLDVWEDLGVRTTGGHGPCLGIGCLPPGKHKTKRYDMFDKLIATPGPLNFFELGSDLDYDGLKYAYNAFHIWFAPTELEGWHNCPAEANLCGCLVVCNRMPSNGMGDYCSDETAMRYDTWEELIECIENPDFSKVPKMQKVLREKIGNRQDNMKRFVEILEG